MFTGEREVKGRFLKEEDGEGICLKERLNVRGGLWREGVVIECLQVREKFRRGF